VPVASLLRFVALTGVIVAVAVALAVADVAATWLVVGVALAWLLAIVLDWVTSRRAGARWQAPGSFAARREAPSGRRGPPRAGRFAHRSPLRGGERPGLGGQLEPAVGEAVEPIELQADEVAPPLPSRPHGEPEAGEARAPTRAAEAADGERAEPPAERAAPKHEPESGAPAGAEVAAAAPDVGEESEPARTEAPRGTQAPSETGESGTRPLPADAPRAEPRRDALPSRPPPARAGEEPGASERQEPPPRRFPPPRLAPPPASPPDRVAASEEPAATGGVVRLDERREGPREWNVWELERLAREETRQAGGADELSYLLLHLRRFATPGGDLPPEFDGLVRASFGPLLARLDRA
jgi:hypothetical protein